MLLREVRTDQIISNKNPQPRHCRTHRPRSRHRSTGDSTTSPSPLRRQKRALCLRTEQERAGPSLRCVTGCHCGERYYERFERPHATN